jgi:RimJ/RimL family protein N-acetyltransferase
MCGETGHRTLRAWRSSDAPMLVEAWADRDIAMYCGVPPDPTLERAERWIAGWEARRRSGASIDVVAVDGDDHVIGEVGVHPVDGDLELGWWVLPAHRGRGVATAMVTGFVAWVADAVGDRPLTARIPPGHIASERVAAAAGLIPIPKAEIGPVARAMRGEPGQFRMWRRSPSNVAGGGPARG